MHRTAVLLLLVVLSVTSVVAPASRPPTVAAQTPPASEISSVLATADIAAGSTSIALTIPRDRGTVRAVRVRAVNGRIVLERTVVVYGSGHVHVEDGQRVPLERGDATPEIDRIAPRAAERHVDSVEIAFEPLRVPTRVEVLGLQTRTGAAQSRSGVGTNVPVAGSPELRDPTAPPSNTRAAEPVQSASSQVRCDSRCEEVAVLFGTNRRGQELRAGGGLRIAFGAESGTSLALGRAVVSIPIDDQARPRGQLTRPELGFTRWRLLRSEDMGRHFTMLEAVSLDESKFLEAVRAAMRDRRSAFVFVHGYNVTFDEAVFRAAQLKYDTRFAGPAFLFSWPSRGAMLSYLSERDIALWAADRLQEFLELVVARSGVAEVHVIAHSLGSSTTVSALTRLARERPGMRLGEIVLAAPAVQRAEFLERIAGVAGVARGVTVYASANDRALSLARRVHGIEPVGLILGGTPVVAAGAHSIDVSALDLDIINTYHSSYAERAELLGDLEGLFQGKGRYPDDRNSDFRRTPVAATPGTFYWRYCRETRPGECAPR